MPRKKQSENEQPTLPDSTGVRASFNNVPINVPTDDLFLKKAALDNILSMSPDTVHVPNIYVDPLFDPVLIFFPKGNIRALNQRLRHYYTYHPIVGHVIDTHVEFSLSDFELTCSDPKINLEYNDQKEHINLTELLIQAGRDYYLLGESYLYGTWNDTELCWDSFVQYPPENIEIYKTYSGPGVVYLLKPDEELKKVLTSPKAADKAIASLIPEDFKQAVRSGVPYLLKNDYLINLSRRPALYVARGTSIVNRVLKYLLLEDKLHMYLASNIDVNMHPIKVWKIGDASKGLMPTKKQIDEFRSLLVQAVSDPSFNIVTHPFISASFETPVGKFQDLLPYFEFLYKRILVGLMASDEFIKGSPSPYATANVSARLVLSRYLAFRTRVENLVKKKIFLPIAKARGYIDKSGRYILPKFKWKMRNLLNEQAERELMMRLRDKGEIPFKILADVFNLDYDQLKEDLKEEQSTVFDPVYREVIREKAKDKNVSKYVALGKKVDEILTTYGEAGERVTKPGRPSVPEEMKKKYEPNLSNLIGTPSRSKPLEEGKETKPMGEEEVKLPPVTPGPETKSPSPPAAPTTPTTKETET